MAASARPEQKDELPPPPILTPLEEDIHLDEPTKALLVDLFNYNTRFLFQLQSRNLLEEIASKFKELGEEKQETCRVFVRAIEALDEASILTERTLKLLFHVENESPDDIHIATEIFKVLLQRNETHPTLSRGELTQLYSQLLSTQCKLELDSDDEEYNDEDFLKTGRFNSVYAIINYIIQKKELFTFSTIQRVLSEIQSNPKNVYSIFYFLSHTITIKPFRLGIIREDNQPEYSESEINLRIFNFFFERLEFARRLVNIYLMLYGRDYYAFEFFDYVEKNDRLFFKLKEIEEASYILYENGSPFNFDLFQQLATNPDLCTSIIQANAEKVNSLVEQLNKLIGKKESESNEHKKEKQKPLNPIALAKKKSEIYAKIVAKLEKLEPLISQYQGKTFSDPTQMQHYAFLQALILIIDTKEIREPHSSCIESLKRQQFRGVELEKDAEIKTIIDAFSDLDILLGLKAAEPQPAHAAAAAAAAAPR